MFFSNFQISSDQAKEIAKIIFADIESYVADHQEEFEEFLKNEEREVAECRAEQKSKTKR